MQSLSVCLTVTVTVTETVTATVIVQHVRSLGEIRIVRAEHVSGEIKLSPLPTT